MVDRLGSRRDIEYVRTMLETGTGADRQLRIFDETQDLHKVVDYMAEENQGRLIRSRNGLVHSKRS